MGLKSLGQSRNPQHSRGVLWLIEAQNCGSANPSLPAGWPGGFLSPSHRSTFDEAGRVFESMPAPTNLEISPYRFASDSRILIGDAAAA